jgi:glucose/arabinose dehydrogenase
MLLAFCPDPIGSDRGQATGGIEMGFATGWRNKIRRGTAVFVLFQAALASTAFAQPKAEPVATGLANPWAVAFLEGGRFLVTERGGRIRVVEADGKVGSPLPGVPPVATGGQGGLLDLVLDSGFERNRQLYFCFSEPGRGGNSTALARARLAPDRSRLEDVQVIFSQKPKVSSSLHFGCRIVETAEGHLFLTLGERFTRMQDSQRLDNHLGKILRLTKDGGPAPGNPFAGREGALPEIWSFGHRNSQGATIGPDGRFWMHEHGPQGGDEINLPQPGRNYGWPAITYGENYGGGPIGEGITARAGLEQPLHYWVPSIAPSGMVFLTSDRYGAAWKGSLFVGSLKFGYLDRIEIADGKVAREQKLLEGIGRVRDVRQGPDGLLYLLTDSSDGRLLRLQP